ncbi:MAG: DUF11 domain-containing protein, partial [Holophagales bacterium]|nr:DUF11 domain-containing protein [Holophagales bacterium]
CAEDPAGIPFCSLGTIEANGFRTVTVTVHVPSSQLNITLRNEVSVSSANLELDPSDNSSVETTTVEGQPGMADLVLTIEERSADPLPAGETLEYQVTVFNAGPHQVLDAQVSLDLPTGIGPATTSGCAEDPGGAPTCSLGLLDVGTPRSFTVSAPVDILTSGLLSFSATVTSSTEETIPASNTDLETTEIEAAGLADLHVRFSGASATVAPGGAASYTITVENTGPDDTQDVVVETQMSGPAGAGTTTGCAEDPIGLPTCTLGAISSLEALASTSFTIELPVLPDATESLVLTSTVSSPLADPDPVDDTATVTTELDDGPPTVTGVDSVEATGDGSLDGCEETRVETRQLLVTFSEEMYDPAGDSEASDVTNPAVYLLVAAGANRDLETDRCGPAQEDDELVPVSAVTWSTATLTATLDLGPALPNGPYRLLVCDPVTDTAGNGLDGNGNGSPGGDFHRYFRVDVSNLFLEGHFDCDLDPWQKVATSVDTEITFTAFDVDQAQISGAAVFFNNQSTNDYSIGQCVVMDRPGIYRMSADIWLRDLEADLTVSKTCEYFPEEGCVGTASDL